MLLALVSTLVGAGACVPHVQALPGIVAAPRLPPARLPPGHRRVVFTWQYDDPDMTARGEGVARIASPDSVRLDLFLAGGFGSAVAFLVGDSLHAPGGDLARRLLPPVPLAWAALGRLALPPFPDTVARVDGGLLRADIGHGHRWRVTFAQDSLLSVERIEGDRLLESVHREVHGTVRYAHLGAHRKLTLSVTRTDSVTAFDRSVWQR
ncbi:MAG: hypothetical protein NVS1B4_23320 [Gemmatimonadaceae bacterium]